MLLNGSSGVTRSPRSKARRRPLLTASGVGEPSALPIAIAEAATAAAAYIDEHGLGPMTFEVSRIRIVVSPNPGPTTYRAIITPGG